LRKRIWGTIGERDLIRDAHSDRDGAGAHANAKDLMATLKKIRRTADQGRWKKKKKGKKPPKPEN